MVVGESKRTANIMDGIENTGDVRMHDHRLRLKQRFDIVRKLGQGTYGKVQLGINKKTGQEVAIKTIKKCKIESEADLIRIRREVQIMSSVRHPNIVHIYEVFENSEKMILVMEYCSGGELYDYLSQKKVLQEDEARRLFRQIATAVYYCHIHKICHRDLKLENVLLDDTGSAKIADFGLSNVFKETSLLSTFCGSPLYASPEIVKGTPYIGPEVDCWSLGVLLYTLVYGAMPFDGSNFKRLVRQISNGDYYEPRNPSSASPLIRDMLTVDPLKRADIAYICDNPWVNTGCETSCLEMAEALAAQTPVRLDLLLSLAPAAPSNSNSVVVPNENELGPEESCTDLTSSTSMAHIEPSNSAEKRILDLVAEGGEDAIKPSPTRTIVSASDNKRKLELAMSASGLQRKKERVASCASIAPQAPVLPEECSPEILPNDEPTLSGDKAITPNLKSSATITIQPSPVELARDLTKDIIKEPPKEEPVEKPAKPRVVIKKKTSPTKTVEEKLAEKVEEAKPQEETKQSAVASAADKLTSLSIAQQPPANQVTKPKKLSIPGGNVGSFKDQFERRASLTTAPEIKRNISKPVVSKIAKPKAQSEDRELQSKTADNGTVRLQQIGIEPSQSHTEAERESNLRSGVKKTESEPSHSSNSVDPAVLLQDARRSLQNSMAKLVEEKAGEEHRRRAARDIISSAIRTGKPPMPYGRSSSAGVASLSSPPGTPPAQPASAGTQPRVFRTEAQHRVEDHRNANSGRGVSVERIIPITVAAGEPTSPPPLPSVPPPSTPGTPKPLPTATTRVTPLRRLTSNESGSASEACSSPGEPIKKSAREFIIPIAVEGKGYVTPRQRSLEPEAATHVPSARHHRTSKPRRMSLVSGGESEEEEDAHMHRLRPSRAARAESVSSGEDDEEDEGFHLLTAENLFSTLLHRVRALTNRLNGEEGPGFSQHSLFNNLQSPFFNRREGWGSRDMHADFDSMFKPRTHMPRGSSKKTGKHRTGAQNAESNVESGLDLSDLDLSSIEFSEREMRALSGLTPALSRRLQRQLLAHLPPAAARTLRRTLSLHAADVRPAAHPAHPAPPARSLSQDHQPDASIAAPVRSHSVDHNQDAPTPVRSLSTDHEQKAPAPASGGPAVTDAPSEAAMPTAPIAPAEPTPPIDEPVPTATAPETPKETKEESSIDAAIPQYSTLPRPRRRSSSREVTPLLAAVDVECPSPNSLMREPLMTRPRDRPLLSKYLTPERALSLDDTYGSDGGSGASEPSSTASSYGTASGAALRRHSLRVASGEQPRRRVSRFLRSDFFDSPPDENLYERQRKERELETQKILREIREKRNKSQEAAAAKSPIDVGDTPPIFRDDITATKKCLSPIGLVGSKERSRSNTPFFPILDNIKETVVDSSASTSNSKRYTNLENSRQKTVIDENSSSKDSRLIRPKSYPVKTLDSIDEPSEHVLAESSFGREYDKERTLPRESKLIRPKSYPASSPSPEKVYVSRNVKIEDSKDTSPKEEVINPEIKSDVEVSFSITLPKKKPEVVTKSDSVKSNSKLEQSAGPKSETDLKPSDTSLSLKKYSISKNRDNDKSETTEVKTEDGMTVPNGGTSVDAVKITSNGDTKHPTLDQSSKKDETVTKTGDTDQTEKKGTVKKKVIRKVSSKSKTDLGSNQETSDAKTEKKKVTKKVKEKVADEDGTKSTVTKKKSVLQSIGHKLEKFASNNKSSSPEKGAENSVRNETKKDSSKLSRLQREQSVPVNVEPTTESSLIKRAVTLTDVAALETQQAPQNKTTVSKVLGLFKKFEPKERSKPIAEKTLCENPEQTNVSNCKTESNPEPSTDSLDKDKPRRPTSLLLNGLGRKNKYGRTSSDSVSTLSADNDDQLASKKENESKNIRNSLKLDFSRLPRVKKIVPTNPVIEPQIMNISSVDGETEKKDIPEKNAALIDNSTLADNSEAQSRSRSRSRSTISNSELKSDISADNKFSDRNPLTPSENTTVHLRNHDSTTPEKEDIVDRIRRKSFYSRFNEKKQRRKSNLVGPGASEYDPVARIHSQPTDTKYDLSPTSPHTYDLSPLSPGLSVSSDLSPSTERYRSLLTDLPVNTRNNLRFENYGLNDKIDTYRSLDRNDFRKYPGSRSYLDYDQPSSYGANRYSRTKSLLDSSDGTEDNSLVNSLRDPHKYNRTISMYSPGNYATYRPKRTTRNSAIILKESEKEKSPENILEKIRQRKKISISVTRKPDTEKETLPRSNISPKGDREGDGAECSEKVD